MYFEVQAQGNCMDGNIKIKCLGSDEYLNI